MSEPISVVDTNLMDEEEAGGRSELLCVESAGWADEERGDG